MDLPDIQPEMMQTVKSIIEFLESVAPGQPLVIVGANTMLLTAENLDHLHQTLMNWMEIYTPLEEIKEEQEINQNENG